ncbi:uncharacterized protein HD556DRAFT_1449732 [Suillus plorans]|uniref:Uncharacterized protein n=1 Tax=Suillus plorans TaxID=116603 RepID=A0A9P7AC64_9AGAM|nr:uncharacterized protein HD556DRAFT_1449732 [Suillus plorans]KAG1786353.1 hypothetical protein HD556DRAFT_1449732 [Suillus plorans]
MNFDARTYLDHRQLSISDGRLSLTLSRRTMGHSTWGRSRSSSSRQHVATQRWLSKPGVREAQNAKARARVALNRARKNKKLAEEQKAPVTSSLLDDGCEDPQSVCEELSRNDSWDARDDSWDANDDSVLTMENDLPCTCNPQTLDNIEIQVRMWRMEWLLSAEDTWGEAYEEALAHAEAKGGREANIFLDQCAQHVSEGKMILDSIREVVHTNCPYCRQRLKYDSILLYDLLVSLMSEIKFIEVKLDTSIL